MSNYRLLPHIRMGTSGTAKKGVWVDWQFCMLSAALMAPSRDSNMSIYARVIARIGIDFINVILPRWVSELSHVDNRGSSFSLVF
jgi:hypothetical protein